LLSADDPRAEARSQIETDFGGRTYATLEELCADANVEVAYIATPHQFHAEQSRIAFKAGRHALVEKPMALTLDECRSMIEAAHKARRNQIVLHSHSFDAPIAFTRTLIEIGEYGRLKMN